MPEGLSFTLPKAERLNSQKLINRLFCEPGSRAMTAFPMRAVYVKVPRSCDEAVVRILISVPKKKLHHAVDRNRVKRLVREAYRHMKVTLVEKMSQQEGEGLLLAFVWISDEVKTSDEVNKSMNNLLNRVTESV